MKKKVFMFGGLMVLAGILISVSMLASTREKKLQIDIGKNVVLEYMGTNGEGIAEVRDNDIDNIDNASDEMTAFFLSFDYNISNNGFLKNGEEVTVTVKYPEDKAEELGVKVINNTKTLKVDGLREPDPEEEEVITVGANDDWIQGNCIDETHYKDKKFLFEEYGLPSITFKWAEEYGNDSSQLYKIRPIMDGNQPVGYEVIFKE